MTRIVVVDDHPIFRHGVVALFESHGLEVVGQAATASEAIAVVQDVLPDALVLDLGLPDASGVEVCKQVTALTPGVKVVVVTMFDDEGSVREALLAGASGYVVKDAPPSQLLAAVRAAEQGAVVLSPTIAAARVGPRLGRTADPFGLTPRERDILGFIEHGLGNSQIADRLAISGKTVANAVSVILAKLRARDRAEAARIAKETYTD